MLLEINFRAKKIIMKQGYTKSRNFFMCTIINTMSARCPYSDLDMYKNN